VIATHDIADYFRALPVLAVGTYSLLAHGEDDAALNRLHAIAHIRKSTRGDHAQSVVEVATADGLVKGDIGYGRSVKGKRLFATPLAPP
jgi:hypothetical protein